MAIIVSKTDLARRTRNIVDLTQRGNVVHVRSYGADCIVLLDALTYRLLTLLASRALPDSAQDGWLESLLSDLVEHTDGERRAASKLSTAGMVSQVEVIERLGRLGIHTKSEKTSSSTIDSVE